MGDNFLDDDDALNYVGGIIARQRGTKEEEYMKKLNSLQRYMKTLSSNLNRCIGQIQGGATFPDGSIEKPIFNELRDLIHSDNIELSPHALLRDELTFEKIFTEKLHRNMNFLFIEDQYGKTKLPKELRYFQNISNMPRGLRNNDDIKIQINTLIKNLSTLIRNFNKLKKWYKKWLNDFYTDVYKACKKEQNKELEIIEREKRLAEKQNRIAKNYVINKKHCRALEVMRKYTGEFQWMTNINNL